MLMCSTSIGKILARKQRGLAVTCKLRKCNKEGTHTTSPIRKSSVTQLLAPPLASPLTSCGSAANCPLAPAGASGASTSSCE